MQAPLPSVDLGRLDPPRRLRRRDVRGRLFYLADLEAIVVAQCRLDGGWRCEIVARRRYRLPPVRIDLTDDEIAATPNRFPIHTNPMQPWEARMLWQAWTYRRWAGRRMRQLCRILAEELRTPHTLTVELHPRAVARLIRQLHLRPPALREFLRRLVNAGALTPLTPAREQHWGRHSLIIPELLSGLEVSLRLPPPSLAILAAPDTLVEGRIR